ncbi:MAG TPA: PEP-CTERM sorting domain-containing protein [Gemmataceae bacterium]|nr:PEP-CTERM sorting domain-containing protein [Gemmataceae bacterium]
MKRLLCGVLLLLAASPSRAGFIINGDFSSGNTGFTTNYVYSPGAIGAQQSYDVLSNPFPAHPSAASYGDHTTGSGLMMAINESTTANQLIWSETVAVMAGSNYLFSAWVSSWVATAPSQVDILFNGVSIGLIQAPSTTAVWVESTATWNSGIATSLTIELRNRTHADVGGDFALDDISLSGPSPAAVPEPSTIVMALSALGVAGLGWLRRRRMGKPLDNSR